MSLFKKDTMAQKFAKAVKKTVKEIGPHKPSISDKIVKTVKKTATAIGPKKPSVTNKIIKALTPNNPPVKQVTVTYGGRDDDFD